MNILELRDATIQDYRDFIGGFVNIRDARIRQEVDKALDEDRLWPEPWLSLNPKFKRAAPSPTWSRPAYRTQSAIPSFG